MESAEGLEQRYDFNDWSAEGPFTYAEFVEYYGPRDAEQWWAAGQAPPGATAEQEGALYSMENAHKSVVNGIHSTLDRHSLALVFHHVVNTNYTYTGTHYSTLPGTLSNILLTCSLWSDLAVGEPGLWTVVATFEARAQAGVSQSFDPMSRLPDETYLIDLSDLPARWMTQPAVNVSANMSRHSEHVKVLNLSRMRRSWWRPKLATEARKAEEAAAAKVNREAAEASKAEAAAAIFVGSTAALQRMATVVKDQHTELMEFVDSGNTDEVIRIIEDRPELLNGQADDGFTALMNAVYSDNIDIVNALIDARAALDIQDDDGETALSLAISRNNEIEEALRAAGAKG